MSDAALILVRHAAPDPRPDVPPTAWRLSAAGRSAAANLAERLARLAPSAIVASTEPKAIETADIIAARLTLGVASEPAFDEHRRPDWPFEPDSARVRDRVLRVLTEPASSVGGAETGAAAAARFAKGIAAHPARPLLVASHGTIISLYLAAYAGQQAGAFWSSLRLPEALVLDSTGRLLERIA